MLLKLSLHFQRQRDMSLLPLRSVAGASSNGLFSGASPPRYPIKGGNSVTTRRAHLSRAGSRHYAHAAVGRSAENAGKATTNCRSGQGDDARCWAGGGELLLGGCRGGPRGFRRVRRSSIGLDYEVREESLPVRHLHSISLSMRAVVERVSG